MKEFSVQKLKEAVCEMVQEVNVQYSAELKDRLTKACENETSANCKQVLNVLLENEKIAKEKRMPVCQDTGMVIVFLKVGQDVHFVDGLVNDAINEGVKQGYLEGYLRKSIVNDPLFERKNTLTNTPCIIYTEYIKGERVELEVLCKGFGSENMSRMYMLKPAQGLQGVKDSVLDAVKRAGPNACPPLVVGVGIGGTFDYAAVLAKKASGRETSNLDERYARLEQELLNEINDLHIGAMGLKGDTTALRVCIEQYPTHIAGLPCAVNICCHVARHAERIWE
ncbi:MAG: fumarate hydratase [Erysipelotrichaceae bacterium]|nr:fumarate hydratase [Erysipelotrichaceae bacterium]